MKDSMNAKWVGSLLLLGGLSIAGCNDENIEANVLFLQANDPGTQQTSDWSTWLDIDFVPDTSISDQTDYRLRMNGHWVMTDPAAPEYISLHAGMGFSKTAPNLATGSYVVELVDPAGKAAVTTAPLSFAPGRSNHIIVYGSHGQLSYRFFPSVQAESDAVPEGSVLTRVMNVRLDDQPLDIKTCGTATAPAADCTLVRAALPYGEVWTGELPLGTLLGFPCVSNELCLTLPAGGVGGSCPVAPGSSTYVPAKIQLLAVEGMDLRSTSPGFALFQGNEVGGLGGCLPNR